MYRVSPC